MQYSEMIKTMQSSTQLDHDESEESLKLFIETLASRLTPDERKDFASQLPSELQDIAMSPDQDASEYNNDFVRQFTELQEIDEKSALMRIKAAWETLKQALTPGEIDDIKSQLPSNLESVLT